MDNSIGTMFLTLLNAAMQPLVERIDTLEHDLLIQDTAIAELEKEKEKEKEKAQPHSSTPAGVLTSLMEALNNGAGPYREFCQFLEDSIQESQTIRTLKEQLPGDTSDISNSLWADYGFMGELKDYLARKDYLTGKEVSELIEKEAAGVTEDDVREYANEEIDSRDFIDEDKLDEELVAKLDEKFKNAIINVSFS